MSKQIVFSQNARTKIQNGVNTLANAVKVTLGPKGRNVAIDKGAGPIITKDGVTVAKEISLKDKFENMGAQMVKEVAAKTNDEAGDGTTTATVLAQALYNNGLKLVSAGHNPVFVKRGMEAAAATIQAALKGLATEVKSSIEVANVGKISANNDEEIGKLLADALEKVGKKGIVTMEDSNQAVTDVEVIDGMQFDRGFLSPYFVNNREKNTVEFKDPVILVTEEQLTAIEDVLPALQIAADSKRPLVIIADEVGENSLAAMVMNSLKGTVASVAVKAPGFGDRRKDLLQDIAALTGATFLCKDLSLTAEKVTEDQLGGASKVIVDRGSTTIVGGHGSPESVEKRVKEIEAQLKDCRSDYERGNLNDRIAKFSGGVAVVRVGGQSEVEMKERKHRIEDALNATRAAVLEGIVPGGGTALLRASRAVKLEDFTNSEEKAGAEVVIKACEEPIRQIVANSGLEGAVVVDKVLAGTGNFGYNAYSDTYEDLMVSGVIDPLKVVRCALTNAISVTSLMLTTEAMIADVDAEEKKGNGLPPMGF